MKPLTLDEFRKRAEGEKLYRSLDELARDDDYFASIEQEFPQQALALERGVEDRKSVV